MDRHRLGTSLTWAGTAAAIVLVTCFCWLRFYEPTYGEWVTLPSGELCPPTLMSTGMAWLLSLIRAAQAFVVVFVVVMIINYRRRDP
jgi:hypothetical protein